jgi:hypothetical protein
MPRRIKQVMYLMAVITLYTVTRSFDLRTSIRPEAGRNARPKPEEKKV